VSERRRRARQRRGVAGGAGAMPAVIQDVSTGVYAALDD
jgi:hypothetical protein